jgi:hypothetical protein
MSTTALDQPMIGPVVQGVVPVSTTLPSPNSKLSLLITAPEVNYSLEAPIIDSPIVEDNKVTARFIIDDNVYLDLTLIDQDSKQENEFKVSQFSLFYYIEERRPRAHFVADTIMAVMGLAGRIDLKIPELEVSTKLTVEPSLLEISRMLHRRQTAYRLMVIEETAGKQFLLPSAISEREIKSIAFVYHAIVDRSFMWTGGSLNMVIPATQENASNFAQLPQPVSWPLPEQSLSETVLDQSIYLGRAVVAMEDAVVKNLDNVLEHLGVGDGRQVTLEIHSRQDKYEFTEVPYSSHISWEPKIQALIDLESYLDAAITQRYHALAAATLAGLTEEEKKEVTTFPDIDEAFIFDADGE